jgi:hypothetical protein
VHRCTYNDNIVGKVVLHFLTALTDNVPTLRSQERVINETLYKLHHCNIEVSAIKHVTTELAAQRVGKEEQMVFTQSQ